MRFLDISYGWAEAVFTQQNKRQIFIHPIVNLQKGSYKMSPLQET